MLFTHDKTKEITSQLNQFLKEGKLVVVNSYLFWIDFATADGQLECRREIIAPGKRYEMRFYNVFRNGVKIDFRFSPSDVYRLFHYHLTKSN